MSVHSVRTAWVRRGVACGLALAMLAVAGTAAAQRRPVLVVDGTTDQTGGEGVAALEGQLAREVDLGPVSVDFATTLRTPAVPPTTWPALAATAIDEARAALARFDYRRAADRAHGALDQLAAYADLPDARTQLAELALIEGQALIAAGDSADAELTLRLVHRLEPRRILDPARYLPEVVTAYVAAGRSAAATSKINITAPGAAEVLVDGVVVGLEPERRLVDLTPGPHLVAARGEAILTVGRRIDVLADHESRVDLAPESAPVPVRVTRVLNRLRTTADDAALIDAIAILRSLAAAHDAAVVVHGEHGLVVRLYTASGKLLPARELGDPAVALGPLRPLKLAPRGPREPRPLPLPTEPWYRERWGKVTIGAGVAVVLGGVVTAMFLRDPGSSNLAGKPVVD